jgi:hypothetical protein
MTTATVARMATMKTARLSGFFSPECSSGLLADSAVCPVERSGELIILLSL